MLLLKEVTREVDAHEAGAAGDVISTDLFAVRQAIERVGGRVFNFEFSFSGLQVWSV